MKLRLTSLLMTLAAGNASAQSTYVDTDGIWRHTESNEKVAAFGINYAPMFAHSFRRMKQLNIDHKVAIEQDVYHFSRLGLNAFRVHLWETEITDHQGNLLQNQHLDLFDYTVSELRKRHIQIFLTPLGLLGNGYPDDGTETAGFHNLYDKQTCSHVPEAFSIQANYLKQLMEHVNPYTGIAYKDDPSIIGIELNNEPYHRGTREQTQEYIETLYNALRDSGYKNPLFYNMSQNPYLREIYYKTKLEGFTFQWYPTGLGNSEFTLNILPYINEYPLYTPQFNFGGEQEFRRRAKTIYEFGLSNTRSSYAYAPLAETLRETGFQFAAYFSYDPMSIAAWNTEYPKHFMNLAYTPRQAIGLMIAAAAFRGSESISYHAELDRSVLNEKTRYIYSNGTDTSPASPEQLKHIAGYGSSPLVKYKGTGSYFLDRLSDGAWRLEVMPDAIPLRSPFTYNPRKQAVDIEWNQHAMILDLPGLEATFPVIKLNPGNGEKSYAADGTISVTPGIYLLGNFPADKVSHEYHSPLPEHLEPSKSHPDNIKEEYVLHDGKDHSRIFFSQGSRNKAIIKWGRNLSVTTQAGCYDWDPQFVQFGYAIETPSKNFRTLHLNIRSLHDAPYPVQVELGQNNGQIFGFKLELNPGSNAYAISLEDMKPVQLARHEANPSFLPAISSFKAGTGTLNTSRLESLRFTFGPGLTQAQQEQALGLQLEKASLK